MAGEALRRELIETSVHGSYWVRQAAEAAGTPTLVGFHGYAESAETALREINLIPGVTAWNLISIQGLHPFYNSRSGEVVASWMTKLDREAAIQDNIRYVSRVLDAEVPASNEAPLVFVGFSQGTAMAYRAAALTGRRVAAVVALAGDVPPELGEGALRRVPVALIGVGSHDQWYTQEKLERDLELLRDQDVDCRPLRYQGGHEWTDEFRTLVGRFLESLSV